MADYSKLDHWSIKARKEGYPARSVYKLKEMDEKFGLIPAGSSHLKILDLGSAPGSWSLYILRKTAGRNKSLNDGTPGVTLVSVDLAPLSCMYDQGLFDRPEFFFIQGDFTLPGIQETIISHGPYNLIASDAAPATTGNRSVDTSRSLGLAETALDYSGNALARGGNLVIKVFQGGDTSGMLKVMRSLFNTAKSYKPEACRAESFETYYLGLGRK